LNLRSDHAEERLVDIRIRFRQVRVEFADGVAEASAVLRRDVDRDIQGFGGFEDLLGRRDSFFLTEKISIDR
jgi:hypothetical protein